MGDETSEKELAFYKYTFELFDNDGSGFISKKEFIQCMANVGYRLVIQPTCQCLRLSLKSRYSNQSPQGPHTHQPQVVQPYHQGLDQAKVKAPLLLQSGPLNPDLKAEYNQICKQVKRGQKSSMQVRSLDCPVMQTPTQATLQLHQQPESLPRFD